MNDDVRGSVTVPRALLWVCFDLLSSAVIDDEDEETSEEWALALEHLRLHLGKYLIQ